jgi:hypothetical protein
MSGQLRDHLLGFLTNGLEDHEHQEVLVALETDAELRQELARLRSHVSLLAAAHGSVDPPPRLATRTCTAIWDQVTTSEQHFPASPYPANSTHTECRLSQRETAWREYRSRSGFSLPDWLVLAGILVIAGFLLLPAISHSRFRSRAAVCQNNLRQLGIALSAYSDLHQGYFPQLSLNGPRAFAGVFGPVLRDSSLLAHANLLDCPGGGHRGLLARVTPVTLNQLDQAVGDTLREYQRRAGGDYAYSLGHVSRQQYRGPRNRHRAYFPILADCPNLPGFLPTLAHTTRVVPSNPLSPRVTRTPLERGGLHSPHHEQWGQNVLFEDGHYQLVTVQTDHASRDDFYLTRRGYIAPGEDEEDAVLAPSETLLELPSDWLRNQ